MRLFVSVKRNSFDIRADLNNLLRNEAWNEENTNIT